MGNEIEIIDTSGLENRVIESNFVFYIISFKKGIKLINNLRKEISILMTVICLIIAILFYFLMLC